MADERRSHLSRSKKIAGMVDLYFKRLSGAEEKERKRETQRIKQLARKTALEVMKRWKLAEKVVNQRNAKKLEDQQRQAGKEQLDMILEHSAQLLEARVTTNGSGQVDTDDISSDVDMSEQQSMYSDDSESEAEPVEDDSKLTVEELQKKYSSLPDIEMNWNDSGENSDQSENDEKDEESDHSTVMDSEEEESDYDSDDEEVEDGPGLSALLGTATSADLPDDEEDDKDIELKDIEEKPQLVGQFTKGEPNSLLSDAVVDAIEENKSIAVKTPVPFLLRGTLREYQHFGLDWLAGLYNNNTNGILADEMGLGDILSRIKLGYTERESYMSDMIEKFLFVTPKAVCLNMAHQVLGPVDDLGLEPVRELRSQRMFHHSQVKLSIAFPDKRLLQYDCGKLQRLAVLLQELIAGGHRALIFTQMTRMLDVLEQFLNLHGLRYLRLDGATKIEQRQILTERFNQDTRIPIFILSTRSGGLGINLTGADTVIFYDSDWNPSMDKQCQDRCHRIGQTRDVHIYRLVSEYTIESNILKKAQQKQILDNVVIQEGEFTTDYFNKLSVRDMLGDEIVGDGFINTENIELGGKNLEKALAQAEDADDAAAAAVAMREVNNIDAEDFVEEERQKKSRTATPTQELNVADRVVTEQVTEYDELDDELDDVGHVDEYMIRFIEGGYYWD
ncbi:hypothetical protein D0Z03_001875 [Geotrichum reessii]|nr:hypothetical protein D0Z03_001875 [Galactomyces reessii]